MSRKTSVALFCVIVLMSAAAEASTVVLRSGFERPEIERGPLLGQSAWEGSAAVVVQAAVKHSGEAAVEFQTVSDDRPVAVLPLLSNGLRASISVDMMIGETGQPSHIWLPIVAFGRDGFLAQLRVVDGNVSLGLESSSVGSVVVRKGCWNHFEMDLDSIEHTVSARVNGVLIASGPVAARGRLAAVEFGVQGGGTDKAWFDNLLVTDNSDVVHVEIAGSVGSFRTDTRIFNPSAYGVVVNAYFLPTGNASNADAVAFPVVVAPRQMVILDDVVTTLFARTGLGAIRFHSPGPIDVTQRIYATVADGTVGQFIPGLGIDAAQTEGIILHLKVTGVSGQKGTFRTNIIALNPNQTFATSTWKLYSAQGELVSSVEQVLAPSGVLGPAGLNGAFFPATTADLSDAFITVSSDLPIFAGASVLDNGTTDSVFIPMTQDEK